MPIEGSALLGTVAGLVAAAMAFLIFYQEYERHRLGRRRLWQESLSGALAAFVFFLILSIMAGYWLSYLVMGRGAGADGRPAAQAVCCRPARG
jgi:integral membrane sensor domain MASE1